MEKVTLCTPSAAQLTASMPSARADDIVMKNKADLVWEKLLPELRGDSPLFAILRVDPNTNATTLMIEFPKTLHIPKHTHEKSETVIILGRVTRLQAQRQWETLRRPRTWIYLHARSIRS